MTRGPITGNVHRLPVRTRPVATEAAPSRKPPPAPKGLGASGRAAWKAVMGSAPLLLPDLDAVTVARFCQIMDERAVLLAELVTRGPLLEEPIVSPTGKVVGVRTVINPASTALRATDKALDALADRLALVPSARARLGLTLSTVEKQRLEVGTLLAARFKDDDE